MKKQRVFKNLAELRDFLRKDELGRGKIFLVCGNSMRDSYATDAIRQDVDAVMFSYFGPNPKIEEVLSGLEMFRANGCENIISIGGGSAIDVAKTIKALSGFSEAGLANVREILIEPRVDADVKHLAIPTTAGTGSESTHFAVVYVDGEKYSVASEKILPEYVFLEPKLLETLPLEQRKSTMLDALCQGIESFWSVNSNDESKEYARRAIGKILKNYRVYLGLDKRNGEGWLESAGEILEAANLSGRAINISQTTAAHAMSYKITSLYGVSHGKAVAMVLPGVWKYMAGCLELDDELDPDLIMDIRGDEYLMGVFCELASMVGVENRYDGSKKLLDFYHEIGFDFRGIVREKDLDYLVDSVNAQRLKNNPIRLDREVIRGIYEGICSEVI